MNALGARQAIDVGQIRKPSVPRGWDRLPTAPPNLSSFVLMARIWQMESVKHVRLVTIVSAGIDMLVRRMGLTSSQLRLGARHLTSVCVIRGISG